MPLLVGRRAKKVSAVEERGNSVAARLNEKEVQTAGVNHHVCGMWARMEGGGNQVHVRYPENSEVEGLFEYGLKSPPIILRACERLVVVL